MSISQKELNNRKSIVWFGHDCCMTYEDAYGIDEYTNEELNEIEKDTKERFEKKNECSNCGELHENCKCICNDCGKSHKNCCCLPF